MQLPVEPGEQGYSQLARPACTEPAPPTLNPAQAICRGVEAHTKRTGPSPKVAVDAVFLRRLLAILKM